LGKNTKGTVEMNDTNTTEDLLEPPSEEKPRIRGVARGAVYFALAALVVSLVKSLSFFLYVNSGGLNNFAGEIWPLMFGIYPFTLLVALVLVIASFVTVLFREQKLYRLILAALGLLFIFCSWEIDSYATFGFSSDKTIIDDVRYFAHNEQAMKLIDLLRDVIPMYCQKHNGRLPQLDNWNSEFINTDSNSMKAPLVRELERFAFNKNLAGLQLDQKFNGVVLLFEAERGENRVGNEYTITANHHYGKGSLVLFADMHIEFVKSEDFDKLRWKP
jgi:hypothetical protein